LWRSLEFAGVVVFGDLKECQIMAKSALNELQQQIEAVRRDAFAAGYAAAMASVREFAVRPFSDAKAGTASRGGQPQITGREGSTPSLPRRPRAAARTAQRTRQPAAHRWERGASAHLVEEILQAKAPHALRPAEIRAALQRDKGIVLSFTSVANALHQLQARNSVEQADDGRSWRCCEAAT
jgi:hypothetical protein